MPTPAPSIARLVAISAMALVFALALLLSTTGGAGGATATTVVTASVPTSTTLTNGCTSAAATQFGVVVPGMTPTTSQTMPGGCRIDFGSSNGTARLLIGQGDPAQTAFGRIAGWTASAWTDSWLGFGAIGTTAGTGYVGGGAGIFKTTDYGATWNAVPAVSGVSNHLMAARDDSTVWVSDLFSNNIRKTINSGTSWTNETVALAMPGQIRGIAAVRGTDTVWVIGSTGTIRQQTVAAGAWSTQVSNLTVGYAISAVDASNAWAIGDDATSSGAEVRRWNGTSWTTQTDLPSGIGSTTWGFQRLYATSGSCAFVASGAGNPGIARTNDGGASWTVTPLPGGSRYNDPGGVAFITATGCTGTDTVWAFGARGAIYRSTDGGLTYVRQYSPVSEEYTGAIMWDANRVAAMGQTSGIGYTLNGGTQWNVGRASLGTWYGIAGFSSKDAIAVGSMGKISTSGDSGSSWQQRSISTYPALWAVDTIGASTAVAVGDGGTIIRSTDKGFTWGSRTSGTSEQLESVSFAPTATTVGWAVGMNGTILATTDGGLTWTAQSSGTTENLRDVAAIDESTAWAVSAAGRWLRTTNGGASWSSGLLGITSREAGVAIVAVSDQRAWVAAPNGANGRIFRTSNGGAAWSSTVQDVFDIAAFDNGRVYGVGMGNVVTSTDDGATFSSVSNGGDYNYSIDMLEADVGWGAGRGVTHELPALAVPDFATGVDDWSARSTGMFGVCVQDVALSSTITGPWVEDVTTTPGQCNAVNGEPWAAVPAAASTVATSTGSGLSGRVDFVFGFRVGGAQPPGSYSGGIRFDVLAP